MLKNFLVFLLFFVELIFAQPHVIFEKTLDNNKNTDIGWCIIQSSDGGFVIVGSTGPSNPGAFRDYQGLVIKTDWEGNPKKMNFYGKQKSGLLSSVVKCDGSYIAAGSRLETGYGRQAWLIRFDEDLNILWEKTYGGKKDDDATQIIPAGDNLYYVVGSTKSSGKKDGKSDVWLMKIDIDGKMLWEKTYDLGSNDMGTSIEKLSENRFIISAVSCTANCGGLLQQGFASYFVVDADGNMIFSRKFTEGKKNKFLKVRSTSDGGAIIVGATSMKEKFPSEDTWIVKIDSKGEVGWSKILSSKGRYDGAFDVVELKDGYIVVGYSQIEKDSKKDFDNFVILKLDSTGNVVWKKEWGGKDNDDLYSVIMLDSQTIVAAGFINAVSWPLTKVPGNSDVYMIKLQVDH